MRAHLAPQSLTEQQSVDWPYARAARTPPELREGACAPPQHRKNTRNATPKARRRGEAGPVPGCPAVPGHRRPLARLPLGLAPGAVGFRASRRVVVPPSSEPPNPARQELASRSPPAGSRTPPSLTDPLLGETPDLQPPGGKTLQASSPPRTAPRLTPNRCPAAVPPPSDSYMASPARRRRRPHGREQPEQPTGPGRSWPSTLRWLTPGLTVGRRTDAPAPVATGSPIRRRAVAPRWRRRLARDGPRGRVAGARGTGPPVARDPAPPWSGRPEGPAGPPSRAPPDTPADLRRFEVERQPPGAPPKAG